MNRINNEIDNFCVEFRIKIAEGLFTTCKSTIIESKLESEIEDNLQDILLFEIMFPIALKEN